MEGPEQAVHRRKQSWSASALRNGLKLLHVIVQDWSAFTRNFTFSDCHTRYWKQRFTHFCNAQICNTGSFFSINKWQRKYFSLTCLIQFTLSTFRTYMKIWWCFGSYLCRNIENSKGFTNFQAALYINKYIFWIYYIIWLKTIKCCSFIEARAWATAVAEEMGREW